MVSSTVECCNLELRTVFYSIPFPVETHNIRMTSWWHCQHSTLSWIDYSGKHSPATGEIYNIEKTTKRRSCHFERDRNLLRPKLLTKYIRRIFQEVLSTNNICRSKVVSVTNRKGGNVSERNWRVTVRRTRLNNAFNGFGTNDVYKYNSGGRSVSKRDTGRSLSIIIIIKTQSGRAGVSIWTDYLSGLLENVRRQSEGNERNPNAFSR